LTYLISKDVQEKKQNERFEIYTQALDVDYANLDQAVAAARIAASCYKNSYRQLERDYKAGRVGKEEMLARLQEIRAGTGDAAAILKEFNDSAAENIQTYAEVVKQENTRKTDKLEAKDMRTVTQKTKKVVDKKKESDQLLAELENTSTVIDKSIDSVMTAGADPRDLLAAFGPDSFDECGPCSKTI
ncbi:MAG: hypothetical protein LBF41_07375, partial [Deltaproteobacteria bacterium]|nr:hypothetical protein [Deltaproteobacteria bacterium]